ncbi:hypothetical protein ACI8AC_17930 [Geodermatophilus sp. SYSU D00758]
MTDGQGAAGTGRWRLLDALLKHPVAVAVVTVFTLAAAVTTTWVNVRGPGGAPPPAAPTATGSIDTAEPTPPAPDAAAQLLGVGTCLDAAGEPAPCDAPHSSEVFGLGDCGTDALLGYLGGTPEDDVVRDDLPIASVSRDGEVYCTVVAPSDRLSSRNEDVLLGRAGDSWRRCEDELDRQVGCSEPHVTEVIFDHPGGSTPVDCQGRADEYLETPLRQEAADLELLQDGQRCLIAVRGDNVLTASLRRLRSGSLPIEAAPS